jgi:hypothetical protein
VWDVWECSGILVGAETIQTNDRARIGEHRIDTIIRSDPGSSGFHAFCQEIVGIEPSVLGEEWVYVHCLPAEISDDEDDDSYPDDEGLTLETEIHKVMKKSGTLISLRNDSRPSSDRARLHLFRKTRRCSTLQRRPSCSRGTTDSGMLRSRKSGK